MEWFSTTAEKGGQALCGTICGCIMIPVAICLVFIGEYNYVKDLDNIYHIKQDIVDVTGYDPVNDGKPVAYYAQAEASSFRENTWGMTVPASFGVSWSGQIYSWTAGSTNSDTKQQNPPTSSWSMSLGSQFNYKGKTYNAFSWASPCTGTSCSGSVSNPNKFTMGNFTGVDYLEDDYMRRATSSVLYTSQFYANCTNCATWRDCSTYMSHTLNNQRCSSPASGGQEGDQYMPFSYYPSNVFVTVCSRQTAGATPTTGTWKVLFSNGNYDIMIPGKSTADDCIDIMNSAASATVFIFRIVGFCLFWIGFVLLLSFIEFIADRVTSLIPCGIGEVLDEMIQCLICIVTCPPAASCWLFWFALAWLIFRPLIGGPLCAVALIAGGLMYWYQKNAEKKEGAAENYAPLNNDTGNYKPPQQNQYPQMQNPSMQQPQQQYQPQQQQYQPQYQPQQQYQPQYQQNNAAEPGPPAPAYAPQMMQDANNNGVPDQYEIGLPPGYEARMDPNTNRVYWVNHNNNTSTWVDPRGPQPPTVGV